jgi:hypothetical protein
MHPDEFRRRRAAAHRLRRYLFGRRWMSVPELEELQRDLEQAVADVAAEIARRRGATAPTG